MLKRGKFTIIDCVTIAACVSAVALCLSATDQETWRKALETDCLANLKQWGSAFETYAKDHDGRFNQGITGGQEELWMPALAPYYADDRARLLCPAAPRAARDDEGPGTFTAWQRDVAFPDGDKHCYISSYGINAWTNAVPETPGFPNPSLQWFWRTPQGVSEPNCVPVFGDALWNNAWPRASDAPAPCSVDSGWPEDEQVGEMNYFCIDRHDGGLNLLFMDWSARKVGPKELWTLRWHRQFNTAGPWTKAGGVASEDWPEWMRKFKDY